MIPVDRLEPNDDNPRDDGKPLTVAEQEALDELEASIRASGLQQPILVRPKPGADGFYVIEDGWRRWLSMKEWATAIPAVIRPPRAGENVHVRSIMTGLITSSHQRPLDPIQRAKAYGRLRDEFKMSITEIARSVGLSSGSITNSLILLELAPASQKKVANGQLQVGEAIRILRQQRRQERRRRGGGRQGTGQLGAIWEPDFLTVGHTLAGDAEARCDVMGHNLRRRIGRRGKYKGACGQCWQIVIQRAIEAQVLERCAAEIEAASEGELWIPAMARRWRNTAQSS
jgi:ParB/RepB/Spo0J family partition protein